MTYRLTFEASFRIGASGTPPATFSCPTPPVSYDPCCFKVSRAWTKHVKGAGQHLGVWGVFFFPFLFPFFLGGGREGSRQVR